MKARFCLGRYLSLMAGLLLCSVAAVAVTHAVPTVVPPVSPEAVVPGSQGFNLTVYGAGFVRGAMVNWNNSPRTTTFVSTRQLQAQITASDVAVQTVGFITVTNPGPGGGPSSSSYGWVEVHTATSVLTLNHPKVYDRSVPVWSALAADFNGDGKLDLISGGGTGVLCILGNGDGTFNFGSLIDPQITTPPTGLAFGDFNGDGVLDLVFTQDNELELYLGNGDGSFRLGGIFGKFTYLHRVVAGDFNRDGNLDLATADLGGKVSILLGNGDGTFQAQTDYTTLAGPLDIVTADFNGDGALDLAVASSTNGGAVSLYIGKGDGTFLPPKNTTLKFGVGFDTFGRSLFVDDFDGNGSPDLAVLRNDQVAVLLGTGKGGFKPPVFYSIGGGAPESFTLGDFNSDGKTDMVISIQSGPKISVRLGNGNGTFQKTVTVLKGTGSSLGVVAGDFNGDGLMDFVLQAVGDYVFLQ